MHKEKPLIYFDNAATSFPKPEVVHDYILQYMKEVGANPGRSGHKLSINSGKIVYNTRKEIAKLFNIKDIMRVIFCSNGTEALNLAIKGLLQKGDHAITTVMSHNSSLRPLYRMLQNKLIELTILDNYQNDSLDLEAFKKSIQKNTKVVIINHASNVSGTIQPLIEIATICKERGIILVVDAAQTAGVVDIDLTKIPIDLLAFTGHKSLYGPTGTGGLVISDNFDYNQLASLKEGGTGSFSAKVMQPEFLPDKFESGTLNVAGIAGLAGGIKYLNSYFQNKLNIINKRKELVDYFLFLTKKHLNTIVTYGDLKKTNTGVISFNLQNTKCDIVGATLSEKYNIMARTGLHCAPLAHKAYNSFPDGSIRFSFSNFNTKSEIEIAVTALKHIENRN